MKRMHTAPAQTSPTTRCRLQSSWIEDHRMTTQHRRTPVPCPSRARRVHFRHRTDIWSFQPRRKRVKSREQLPATPSYPKMSLSSCLPNPKRRTEETQVWWHPWKIPQEGATRGGIGTNDYGTIKAAKAEVHFCGPAEGHAFLFAYQCLVGDGANRYRCSFQQCEPDGNLCH